ncbi:sodium:glutamate symporter [Rossellomorea vietnamensis]|uniref:Sodium:glutamate symporter n=1 Tax=Rossellomorea vietnamensis TaxID=218284 RepID=A0A5D4NPL9_9BACI|nr:sodium:glutamate symporter [Rossellomorea vietnamensis]
MDIILRRHTLLDTPSFILTLVALSALLLISKWVRIVTPLFQRYFIPTSIIAGLLGLAAGPQVLGKIVPGETFDSGLFTEGIMETFGLMPEILITIIFAALFLGKSLPGPKSIWKQAGPQLSYGLTVGWGQYVIGLLLALFVLSTFFDLPPAAGALIEISFQGGPGTAAGLSSTFESLNFEDGADLALGLATIGILSAVIAGMIIVNWGIRKNKTKQAEKPSELSQSEKKGIFTEEGVSAGNLTTRQQSIESLTIHVAHIGAAIGIGLLVQWAFVELEKLTWGAMFDVYIFEYVPLFPLAMAGGVVVQLLSRRLFKYNIINRDLVKRIQGLSLDLLITASVASLSLTVIGNNLLPFLILAAAGILWNVLALLFLAPRMMPDHWFERGIVDFGQSMGMTPTGLLLLQIVDPERKTPAFDSFGYKQLLFEPVMGGGLFTAASLPLIVQFGAVPMLILTSVLFVVWLLIGLLHFGRK